MGWPQCNTTLEDESIHEVAIWHDYTFHTLGLWLSAVFGLIAIVVSFFLIYMHASHYLRPYEQRHIIRILFMVPVYAAVSFLSYLYYRHSIYFEVIRDCYEAFAIASFFSLMCAYIAHDLHAQKEYFRTITPRKWIWPMGYLQKCCGGERGIWRTPRSGLTWFNVIWVSIFQYCFIRVFMTVVACITQVFDRYCLESLNPAFAHIWVMVVEATAVSIAMYCLIQFYVQIKGDIAQHKPLLKVLAIKLVIFLSFWQTIAISFLTSTGVIKSSDKFQTPDIKIGIPAMLLCIEMALFAIFHLFAFSWKPYTLRSKEYMAGTIPGEGPEAYTGGFLGVKAIADSMNPWDMIKAIGRAARWLVQGRKHRHHDVSYDLSRKQSEQSANPPAFNGPTAYTGAKPPHYGGGDMSEGQTLLANQQAMGTRMETSPYRTESSPYRTNTRGELGGDIGVARSSDDDQPHPYYQLYHGQQTGVTPAPYSEARGRSQAQMPDYPPPNARRDDNMF